MKTVFPIFILIFAVSCEIVSTDFIQEDFQDPPIKVSTSTIYIDSVLTEDGVRSVTKDSRGYYHVKLRVRGTQQFHRITGRILVEGKEPKFSEKVNWESNLYWITKRGAPYATITKTYINYFTGQFTIIQLPPMVASKEELVPTVNFASYSGAGGRINTIISPIMDMKGDTMVVKAINAGLEKPVYTKIILD